MKASLWTIWFVAAVATTGLSACGVEETLQPVDQGQNEDAGDFQAETGERSDSGPQEDNETAADTPVGQDVIDEVVVVEADDGADGSGSDAGDTSNDAGDPGQTDGESDAEETQISNADVLLADAACQLKFSALYVDGAAAGEIRGNIPGVATWDSGPAMNDADSDGYLEFAASTLPAGTFDLSYVGNGAWALYGAKEQLLAMTPAARGFVYCNWFDGVSEVDVPDPECHLRIAVDAGCIISGAGNMTALQ